MTAASGLLGLCITVCCLELCVVPLGLSSKAVVWPGCYWTDWSGLLDAAVYRILQGRDGRSLRVMVADSRGLAAEFSGYNHRWPGITYVKYRC